MKKKLFITEKPSVAREFAKVFSEKMKKYNGYMESKSLVITWCVGHLVTMSYPEKYDMNLKKWKLNTLPFLPNKFLYEVIPGSKNQYDIVSSLMKRDDVDTIYVCTDSGREGEYIYRLIKEMSKVEGKNEKRVWIDSQTVDEIKRGIKEALPESEYDNLSSAAYLRAKEDYLMGINFSRVLSLKFGNYIASFLNKKYYSIAVGRVMTCVLGMVVRREREIRDFKKTSFYKVYCNIKLKSEEKSYLSGEWKVNEKSHYYNSPYLYKDNGFKEKERAKELIAYIENEEDNKIALISSLSKKTEKQNPPLLYNLAEIQNECSKLFKISPDETLNNIQMLYEKKLVTYPRTDARVLSTAVAKEIDKNIRGLSNLTAFKPYTDYILGKKTYTKIIKSKYVNDKKITDHYALIPTGQGLRAINGLTPLGKNIYELIVRRFLAIFLPPAIYNKVSITIDVKNEQFFVSEKSVKDLGYKRILKNAKGEQNSESLVSFDLISSLKKGQKVNLSDFSIKEGETAPPKRYNSGSIILAMENAGQLIEDESLREMIKSQGIGTSATRAGILQKLVEKHYISLNKKTQVLTPTLEGEIIYDIVNVSIKSLLNAEFTASWEKGLSMVEKGEISEEEYMKKLTSFVGDRTTILKNVRVSKNIDALFNKNEIYYKK